MDVPMSQPGTAQGVSHSQEKNDILACKTAALEDIRGDNDLPAHQLIPTNELVAHVHQTLSCCCRDTDS